METPPATADVPTPGAHVAASRYAASRTSQRLLDDRRDRAAEATTGGGQAAEATTRSGCGSEPIGVGSTACSSTATASATLRSTWDSGTSSASHSDASSSEDASF